MIPGRAMARATAFPLYSKESSAAWETTAGNPFQRMSQNHARLFGTGPPRHSEDARGCVRIMKLGEAKAESVGCDVRCHFTAVCDQTW